MWLEIPAFVAENKFRASVIWGTCAQIIFNNSARWICIIIITIIAGAGRQSRVKNVALGIEN